MLMKPRKRCRCRDTAGRDLGARCPKLRRRDGTWNPNHGTWSARRELAPAPDGTRVELKAGGFATEDELKDWFEQAGLLLAIPERGPRGHEARMQILDLIKQARKDGEDLPDYDDIRLRYRQGAALKGGLLGPYLREWVKGKKDVKRSTHTSYSSHVRVHLDPALGHIPMDRLRVADISEMFDAIEERNERIREGEEKGKITGPVTQSRILATLANALQDAIPAGSITWNPARHVKLTPGKRAKPLVWTPARVEAWRVRYEKAVAEARARNGDRNVNTFKIWRKPALRPSRVMVWTAEQTGAFLDRAMHHRLYAMYHLIAFRGLRRGEACGADKDDFDLDALVPQVAIRNNRVQIGWDVEESDPKTDDSAAAVALDRATVIALRQHLKAQEEERREWGEAWVDTGKIFTLENGEALHPAFVTEQFLRLAFEVGLPPIRLHDLRHGAATLALAAGVDMKLISAMLRHSSSTFTSDVYASVLPEVAQEAAERTAALVPRSTRKRSTSRRTGASNKHRAPDAPPEANNPE